VPPNVILGPPNITESTRAEKVEIKNTIRYCEVFALRLGVQDLALTQLTRHFETHHTVTR